MSKRSKQIYEDLLIEYADENLQVKIDADLLSDLKINKAALTRFSNQWVEENIAKWVGTNTLQLILSENEDDLKDEKTIKLNEEQQQELNDNLKTSDSKVLPVKNRAQGLPKVIVQHLIHLIEEKLNEKLSKEAYDKIFKEVTHIDIWDRAVKNLIYKSIPDKILNEYVSHIIAE